MSEKSVFTRILEGEIPSEILYQDEHCFVIRDIAPKAPTHLLLIPKKPIPKLSDATEEDRELLGHLLFTAKKVAQAAGIGDAFRLVINNGAGAGQTVFHLHLHILGNVQMSEGSLAL
ncbi:MAG: histidine triad nucleotide-binding protein [Porticoccaceae bacterium]|nr:MAG: histidine triad nucleotide-binding protein [Porticoccaceae bacterium]